MWPHNETTSKEILNKLETFIEKEKIQFQTIPDYIAPTHEDIGRQFGIKRKTVEKYAKRFITDKQLYANMWTLRKGKPARNYKKQLKKLIYKEFRQNNILPSKIVPEVLLRQLGEQYIEIEHILLVVKYSYIIYFLLHTKLSTWKIGKELSPIFNQTIVSLRSMALKISLLLEREFDDYSQQARTNDASFSGVSKQEIVRIHELVRKYRKTGSVKKPKEEAQLKPKIKIPEGIDIIKELRNFDKIFGLTDEQIVKYIRIKLRIYK